jgi:hypothetical protein
MTPSPQSKLGELLTLVRYLVLCVTTRDSALNYSRESWIPMPRWSSTKNRSDRKNGEQVGDLFGFVTRAGGHDVIQLYFIVGIGPTDKFGRPWWGDKYRRDGRLTLLLSHKIGEIPYSSFIAARNGKKASLRSTELYEWYPALAGEIVTDRVLWAMRPAVYDEPVRNRVKKHAEEIARAVFELLTGRRWITTRKLDWNKNPATNENLEVDGWNEGLNAGFEQDGVQHYEYVPHLHRNGPADLAALQERDRQKDLNFARHGSTLFRIDGRDYHSRTPIADWVRCIRPMIDSLGPLPGKNCDDYLQEAREAGVAYMDTAVISEKMTVVLPLIRAFLHEEAVRLAAL